MLLQSKKMKMIKILKSVIPVVVLSSLNASVEAVPVVPNFQTGSLTSHTETTSTVTETINVVDYQTGWQYTVTGNNISTDASSLVPPATECYPVSKWCKFDVDKSRYNKHAKLHCNRFKQTVATDYNTQSTRVKISDNNPKNNRDNFSHRHGFNLQSVKYLLVALNIFSTPIYANEVGGVSVQRQIQWQIPGSRYPIWLYKIYRDHI